MGLIPEEIESHYRRTKEFERLSDVVISISADGLKMRKDNAEHTAESTTRHPVAENAVSQE
jgi:hypothetical protein